MAIGRPRAARAAGAKAAEREAVLIRWRSAHQIADIELKSERLGVELCGWAPAGTRPDMLSVGGPSGVDGRSRAAWVAIIASVRTRENDTKSKPR